MSGSAPVIIGVLVAYLFVLLGVGFWASRETTTVKGYFVAGKKLPSWVIAFSSNATGESAWLLLLCALAPGITLALLFLRAHLRDADEPPAPETDT